MISVKVYRRMQFQHELIRKEYSMSQELEPITAVEPTMLKHLIIKLRWMGMEQDAQILRHHLFDIAPEECAGLWSLDTD